MIHALRLQHGLPTSIDQLFKLLNLLSIVLPVHAQTYNTSNFPIPQPLSQIYNLTLSEPPCQPCLKMKKSGLRTLPI